MRRLGICSLCLEYGPLTFEHIPPKRVFNNVPAVAHNLYGLEVGSIYKKKPRLLKKAAGLGRHALCERCNGYTASLYGEEFADWTTQCLRYADRIGDSSEMLLPFQIRPLNVLKQIATMIMAVSESTQSAPSFDRLRGFALSPNSMQFPMEISLASYMNPVDVARVIVPQLTQNRLSGSCAVLDTRIGSSVFVIGEVAFPPMGYVAYITANDRRLSDDFGTLRDLRGFSSWHYNQRANIFLSMPVRRPFGPVPGYYPDLKRSPLVRYIDDNHLVLTAKNARPSI